MNANKCYCLIYALNITQFDYFFQKSQIYAIDHELYLKIDVVALSD